MSKVRDYLQIIVEWACSLFMHYVSYVYIIIYFNYTSNYNTLYISYDLPIGDPDLPIGDPDKTHKKYAHSVYKLLTILFNVIC